MKYFHGGVRNLKIGGEVLPPSITAKQTLGPFIPDDYKAIKHYRYDKVFVTTDLNAARVYASSYPLGDVYEVAPKGEVTPDPDAPEIGFMCDSAEVISVVQRKVKFRLHRLEAMITTRASK